MTKSFCFLLVLLACTFRSHVEAADAPQPAPPLARLPDSIQWTVVYTDTTTPSSPAASMGSKLPNYTHPKSSTFRKSGKLVYEEDEWEDGTRTIAYQADDAIFSEVPYSKTHDVLVMDGHREAMTRWAVTTDFPELGWINRAKLTGFESHAGKNCEVCIDPTGAKKVWVDKDTGLPVTRQEKDFTAAYTFSSFSGDLPPVPPDIHQRMDMLEQARKKFGY